MPESSDCQLLTSTRDLENFSPSWSALWTIDCNATPFQSPEWLLYEKAGLPNPVLS